MSIDHISQQDTIQQVIARLIAVQTQPIGATDTIKNDINTLKSFQDAYCCASPEYLAEIAAVRNSVPNTVTQGTVGEYLYGCFQPELVGQIACTPACVNGLKNPDLQACNVPSFVKTNGTITKINEVMGNTGNLYLAAGQVYTEADRQYLLSEGLQSVTVYSQDGANVTYILGETADLNQPVTQQPAPTNTNATWAWGWIWLVIIIIIVIILAIFLARSSSGY